MVLVMVMCGGGGDGGGGGGGGDDCQLKMKIPSLSFRVLGWATAAPEG